MFLTGAKDGQLLCPTAGAVFMLLRLAMSAAAMHAKNVYASAPARDGCRRLVLVKSLPVSHSPDGQPVAVSASLTAMERLRSEWGGNWSGSSARRLLWARDSARAQGSNSSGVIYGRFAGKH